MAERATLAINEGMTIYHALEQKQQLMEALHGADHLALDLSQVGEMDSAGLQLLILCKRTAQAASKELAIVAHSQAVQDVIDFCNIAAYFGDPVVIPARATPEETEPQAWTN
jgi:anti-sigma B factor antagonist